MKVNADSKAGIALRKNPNSQFSDEVLFFVENGSRVTVFNDVKTTDLFGDSVYVKVRLESGKEGFILLDALEEI
jgi:hypothetical protein